MLNIHRSVVILVDVQQKLTPLVQDAATMLQHQKWLLELSNELAIPLIVAEQYPKGLGKTVEELASVAEKNPHYFYFDKCDFSCAADPILLQQLDFLQRDQIILVGIETHVCVLQTALDLKQHNYAVYVMAEGVSSRQSSDKEAAFNRMSQQGVQIVTREMILFEWLRTSEHPQFRDISKKFLK